MIEDLRGEVCAGAAQNVPSLAEALHLVAALQCLQRLATSRVAATGIVMTAGL